MTEILFAISENHSDQIVLKCWWQLLEEIEFFNNHIVVKHQGIFECNPYAFIHSRTQKLRLIGQLQFQNPLVHFFIFFCLKRREIVVWPQHIHDTKHEKRSTSDSWKFNKHRQHLLQFCACCEVTIANCCDNCVNVVQTEYINFFLWQIFKILPVF